MRNRLLITIIMMFICTSSWATVKVYKFPTKTPVTVATTSDIPSSNRPDYDRVPYDGATDSVVLAGYNLQAGTITASDSVLSTGEVHGTDVTASGKVVVAGNTLIDNYIKHRDTTADRDTFLITAFNTTNWGVMNNYNSFSGGISTLKMGSSQIYMGVADNNRYYMWGNGAAIMYISTNNANMWDIGFNPGDKLFIDMGDNRTDAFAVTEGATVGNPQNGRQYININTTDGAEEVWFGNTDTNPIYSFNGNGPMIGSGNILMVGEIHTGQDLTASGNVLSAGEIHSDSSVTSSGEVLAVSATTQVLNVYSTMTASGQIIFMDNRGGGNELGMLATHLDEENSNTLLDMSRSTLTCSGGILTYTLYALNGHGTWNFHGTIYPVSVPSVSVTLTGGTDLNPKTNYIYFELQSDVPTMVAATSEPTGEHIDVATFVIGAISGSNYTTYSYARNRHETDTFVNKIIEKAEYEGTLYKSGLVPGATTAGLTVGAVGDFFTGIFEMTSNNALAFDAGYYFIKSDGTFNKSTSLSDITQYSDGTAIPANGRVNVVWGVVPTTTTSRGTNPTVVKLVAVVQSTPASTYTTDLQAEQDASGATNYFPTNTEIKKVFVPVMRTIVQPNTPAFKAFSSAAFYKDIRGKITSGGGAATPVDLSGYVPYTGAIDNLALGNYYARAFSLSSSDFVVSVGEIHSSFDVTASGQIIAATTASAPIVNTDTINLASRATPAVLVTGQLFFDGTNVKFYDGTNWKYVFGWGD